MLKRTMLVTVLILGLSATAPAAFVAQDSPSLRGINDNVANLALNRPDAVQLAGGYGYGGYGYGPGGGRPGHGGYRYPGTHSSGYRGMYGPPRIGHPSYGGHNNRRRYDHYNRRGYSGYGYGGHGSGGFGLYIGF